jgi:autoinducer 2-degrading protein
MDRVHLIVRFGLSDNSREQFLPLMDANRHASLTLEPGCLQFEVLEDLEGSGEIVLYEIYENETALNDHKDMDHVKTFFATAKPFIDTFKMQRLADAVAGTRP